MTTTYRFAGNMPATAEMITKARRSVRRLETSGLSRREIARRAGVAPTSITNLMQPRPRISKPVAAKLTSVR